MGVVRVQDGQLITEKKATAGASLATLAKVCSF